MSPMDARLTHTQNQIFITANSVRIKQLLGKVKGYVKGFSKTEPAYQWN